MHKKRYLVADAAAAFPIHMVQFPTPSIFSFRHERECQWAHNGRILVPWSKDKLPRVQSICFEHQSLPPTTINLMQSGLYMEGKGRKREGKRVLAQRRFMWDGRRLTRLSLTYRCCSVRRGMAGEIAVHHPEYNQQSTWLES